MLSITVTMPVADFKAVSKLNRVIMCLSDPVQPQEPRKNLPRSGPDDPGEADRSDGATPWPGVSGRPALPSIRQPGVRPAFCGGLFIITLIFEPPLSWSCLFGPRYDALFFNKAIEGSGVG